MAKNKNKRPRRSRSSSTRNPASAVPDTTTSSTSIHDNNPAEVEPSEDAIFYNNPDVDEKEKIKSLLKALWCKLTHDSTQLEASGVNEYMCNICYASSKRKKEVAETIIDLQGVSILLFKLEESARTSQRVTEAILGVLCELTCYDNRSGSIFVDLGGVGLLLSVAQKYSDHANISTDVVSILVNLNINEESLDAVIGDECIEYCLQVMKKFPDDLHAQAAGVKYFSETSKIEEKRNKLEDQKVDIALLLARHKFRGNRTFEYEEDICRETIARLYE